MSEPLIEPNVDITAQVTENIIVAAKGGYETHPESYSPRVFVYVKSTDIHYEILRTGEAVPWVTKKPEGRLFWIFDCQNLSDVGVHRANPGIDTNTRSHNA